MKRIALVLLLPLLAACLGDVPTSGPLNYGRENNIKAEENFVRAIVAPPVPGADPVGIVRGFLSAVAADESDFATARLFLTESALKQWNPGTDRRIVADRSQVWEYDNLRSPGLVTLKSTLVGELKSSGEYQSRSGNRSDQFRLQLVGEEWRISALPEGITITQSDLDRTYREVAVYFPDQLKRVLIPINLYVPIRPGLATSLVRTLLRGPAGWLAPSLTTAFPNGSALSADSVPIVDGVANVDLNANAAAASSSDRVVMAAQLGYTLRQIPEFRRLALSAGGAKLPTSPASWSSFSLSLSQSDSFVYFNTERGLYSISVVNPDAQPAALASDIPDYTRGFTTPALNADRSAILTLDVGGVLTAGNVTRDASVLKVGGFTAVLRSATRLAFPQWDLADHYWVGGMGEKFSLWSGRGTAVPTKVQIPAFAGVESFAVARDGVRLLISSRSGGASQLTVMRLVRVNGVVRAEGAKTIWSSTSPIVHMHGSGPEEVAALVGGKRIITIDLRTSRITQTATTPNAISFAAHPGRPLVIETEDHRILVWRKGKWQLLTTGRNPNYSG